MNSIKDITNTSKITSAIGAELMVDKIFPEGIYTSGWNMKLSGFDRLYYPIRKVEEMLSSGQRLLVDGRIKMTKAEIENKVKERRGKNYIVKDFIIETEEKSIVNMTMVRGDRVFLKVKNDIYYTIIEVDTANKLYKISLPEEGLPAKGEKYQYIEMTPEEVDSEFEYRLGGNISISLEEFMRSMYDLGLEFLSIVDDDAKDTKETSS